MTTEQRHTSAPGGYSGGQRSSGGSGGSSGGPGGRPSGPFRRPGGGGGGRPRFFPRRKVCAFCADKGLRINYKDVQTLRRFISDQNKMESRRKSGVCSRHQRSLATAIKRARFLALIPFNRIHRTGQARSFL